MSVRDYYEVLGVAKDANESDIKSAYRKQALKYHPDRNPGDTTAEEKFKEAAEAYSVLGDAEKRARFDRFGHAGVTGAGAGGGPGGGPGGGRGGLIKNGEERTREWWFLFSSALGARARRVVGLRKGCVYLCTYFFNARACV